MSEKDTASSANIAQRVQDLQRELNYHIHRYHVLDDPVISDAAYDSLYRELVALEQEHPELISPDSPTQRVGAEPSAKFAKVAHPAPILSLGNCFNVDDFNAWRSRIGKLLDPGDFPTLVIEPKFDGLTVVLRYESGLFTQGATRGNGVEGEDITTNLRTIQSLPLRVPVQLSLNQEESSQGAPHRLVVRGEVYMSSSGFKKMNSELLQQGNRTFANPRNAAAGSLRQLDPQVAAQRPLILVCYEIVEKSGDQLSTQVEQLNYLSDMGFPTPDSVTEIAWNQDLSSDYSEWIKRRSALDYEVDGLVIKISDIETRRKLGVVGKDPRGATALKFPAEEAVTRLSRVEALVGRSGVITPLAHLEPIEIGGVTVKQATLHNYDFISRNDLRIGDAVVVKRAGDVIPYIVGPVESLRTGDETVIKPPALCPICSQEIVAGKGEIAIYCTNLSCPAQVVRRIEYFVSRSAMNIETIGSKTVQQLVDAGLVSDPADLYSLTEDKLLELEGFQETKARNVIQSIALSKEKPSVQLLIALGIKGVGEAVASELISRFGSIDLLSVASIADLEAIPGIGPNIASSVADWFIDERNLVLIAKLKKAGVSVYHLHTDSVAITRKFEGLTFVITGTLESMSRSEAKAFIVERGGKVTGSVSSRTDYLLCGDNPGSKLAKAQKLGIQVIGQAELIALVE